MRKFMRFFLPSREELCNAPRVDRILQLHTTVLVTRPPRHSLFPFLSRPRHEVSREAEEGHEPLRCRSIL